MKAMSLIEEPFDFFYEFDDYENGLLESDPELESEFDEFETEFAAVPATSPPAAKFGFEWETVDDEFEDAEGLGETDPEWFESDWEETGGAEIATPSGTVANTAAGERYVDTSTWHADPLRGHGGTGDNLLMRWNAVPAASEAIDVVVHLHGYIGLPPNAATLRALAARSGLDLAGRTRPTLAILPRGRRITAEEVQKKQALLNERARRLNKKPGTARSDVYTFPALLRDDGAGLAALISAALQWFARTVLGRSAGATVSIARLILTAHSGGGAALDRLVALHARRKVCNPDEVHAFDALYSEASGLKSWATARLRADRGRRIDQMDTLGGGLRVFYRPGEGATQLWSEQLGRSLPPRSDALSRFYRIECTRVGHLEIPNEFGPALLRDRTADLSSRKPCSGAARSPRAASKSTHPKQSRSGSARRSGTPVTPAHAPLPSDVQAWIRSTERSAIELVADEAQRRKLLQEIDWSREYFPRNPDAQKRKAPGRLAEELFHAMARVVPERRVPSSIRYRHDIAGIVVEVPGHPKKKLHPEAAKAFVRLREAAAKDGIPIRLLPGPRTAWRSAADQAAIRRGQPNPYAAAVGISPHMYGLAVDLQLGVRGLPIREANTRTPEKMANVVRMYRSPIYKWLVLNGSRFGWFPYRREPWHWEYNPPGFAARFEGNTGTGTARELGATPHERSSAGSLWTPVRRAAPYEQKDYEFDGHKHYAEDMGAEADLDNRALIGANTRQPRQAVEAPKSGEFEAYDEETDTVPTCENRISTVTVWLNAFIPRDVPGLTRKVPDSGVKLDPSMAGKTMFDTFFGCGLTDQRSLSADINASSRMHSEAKIDLDKPHIIYQKHRIDPSVEVNCMTGKVLCKGTSSTSPMNFSFKGVTSAKEIMIHVRGSQGPACPKSKIIKKVGQFLLNAKIDYEGTFFIKRVARNYVDIGFLGYVDLFPAYEFVAMLNDSNPIHLGGRLPAAGSSPVTHLGARQKIHFVRRLWLKCSNGKQVAGLYERIIN
jgi:hypothetical protein